MEKLLTPRQVADFLGIQINVLYQWTHKQIIPHLKLSRRMIRFSANDLQAWIERRKTSSIIVSPMKGRVEKRKKQRSNPGADENVMNMIDKAKKEVMKNGNDR